MNMQSEFDSFNLQLSIFDNEQMLQLFINMKIRWGFIFAEYSAIYTLIVGMRQRKSSF